MNRSLPLLLSLFCPLLAAVASSAPAAPASEAPASEAPAAESRLTSLMVRDASAEYAMWILSEAWGRQIVVTDAAKRVSVRAYLRGIACMDALKALCRAHGLWFREDPDSGLITVETLEEYVGNAARDGHKFVETVTVVYPRAEDIAASLEQVFNDMVVYNPPEEEDGDPAGDIDRALDRMDQLSDRATMVEDDAASGGGSSSRSRSRRSSNLTGLDNVTDYYRDMDRLNRDNAAIVTADTDGVPRAASPSVVFVAVARDANAILLRSSDRDTLRQVREVIAELDRPKPQVLLEVKVLALDITDEKDRQLDILFSTGRGNPVSGGFVGGYDGGPVGGLTSALDTLGSFSADAAALQYISDHLSLRLKYLDEKGKVRRLATPNLMVSDYEASRIFVGKETSIILSVETSTTFTGSETATPTTSTTADIQRTDIGTTLVITPKIHADGSVTLRLLQENAEEGSPKSMSYGPSAERIEYQTTDVIKQSIVSTVVARSGETLALGGLVSRRETENVARVPWLADIPWVGPLLFERQNRAVTVEELIVLVRPYVILSPGDAERMSRSFLTGLAEGSDLAGEALGALDPAERQALSRIDAATAPLETPVEAE